MYHGLYDVAQLQLSSYFQNNLTFFAVAISARLDRLEENQEITIRMLRNALSKSGYESDDEDDMLPATMTQVQEIEALEAKLEEKAFRRKLVNKFYK